jgi:hypothetical protein
MSIPIDKEEYSIGDLIWIGGKDFYYECKIQHIAEDAFVIESFEDSKYDMDRTVVMFFEIDSIGKIT